MIFDTTTPAASKLRSRIGAVVQRQAETGWRSATCRACARLENEDEMLPMTLDERDCLAASDVDAVVTSDAIEGWG